MSHHLYNVNYEQLSKVYEAANHLDWQTFRDKYLPPLKIEEKDNVLIHLQEPGTNTSVFISMDRWNAYLLEEMNPTFSPNPIHEIFTPETAMIWNELATIVSEDPYQVKMFQHTNALATEWDDATEYIINGHTIQLQVYANIIIRMERYKYEPATLDVYQTAVRRHCVSFTDEKVHAVAEVIQSTLESVKRRRVM